MDYAGPLLGKMFLVLIDTHSKWIEVESVESATTKTTEEKLRKFFQLMEFLKNWYQTIFNGSVFTSQEFTDFVKLNEIDHIITAPYHPSSNGLAESAVQVLKKGLSLYSKTRNIDISLDTSVVQLPDYTAFHNRNITCGSINGLQITATFRFVTPQLNWSKRYTKQWQQKHFYKGNRNSMIDYYNGMRVYMRNYIRGRPWVAGVVQSKTGPLHTLSNWTMGG